MKEHENTNISLEEQLRDHYQQSYSQPPDVTQFWAHLSPQLQERAQSRPWWQHLFLSSRHPIVSPRSSPGKTKHNARVDKMDVWAAVFLTAVLVGSLTIVLNLAAAHKGNGHTTQVAGGSTSASIYFTTSQGTVNRMDKTSHVILWKHEVDGLYSLVIAGDALYMSAYNQTAGHGYVYALNTKDGSVRWRADIGPREFLTAPAVGDGAVYVMQWTGKIYALNIRNGKINWVYDTKHKPTMSGGFSSPGNVAVANGMVYDTILNTLFAINGKNGTLAWSKQIGKNYLYGSPHVENGVVYLSSHSENNFGVGPQNGFIYAYDGTSGKQNWVHPVGNPGPSEPTIANGLVLFAATNVYALKASNGQEVWRYPVGQELFNAPYVADGVVYEREDGIIGGPSPVTVKPALLALKLSNGTKLWSRQINVSIGAVQDGIIYAGLVPRQLATFRATNGALLWHQNVEKTQQQQHTPDDAPRVWLAP